MYIVCGSFVGTIAPRVTSPGGAAPSPSLACATAVARLAPRSPHERVRRLLWFRREIRVSVALAIVAVALAVTACGAGSRNVATAVLPLHRDPVVALPGGPTRFDYADVDPGAHLLFVAHLGDSALIELDTRTRKVIRVIPNLPSVRGVIVVPSLHRVFATATGAAQVVTPNEDTGAVLAQAPAGEYPDGLAYVPATNQVWISDESGGGETVIDASSGARVATVELSGEAGNVRYDPIGKRVLVAVQSRNQLVSIDPATRRIIGRFPIAGCEHSHGLTVDATRAFVGCDANDMLVVLSLADLQPVARLAVGAGPDVLAVDAPRHLLYVAAESGALTMIDTRTARCAVIVRASLAAGAHVVAVNPLNGEAYFPLPTVLHGNPGLLITTIVPANR